MARWPAFCVGLPVFSMKKMVLLAVLFVISTNLVAQERFSLFVGSDIEDVRRMLTVAGLKDNDVIYDLGSGDGRIVLEAARLNLVLRGRGIEIDENLVRESNAAAKAEGYDERVQFLHQDAFDADLKDATVITMWLFPELMRLLRTKILAEATPGTRVVTRIWDLGTWKADYSEDSWPYVYMWVVPARAGGYWTWQLPFDGAQHTYSTVLEQDFQNVEGVVRVGNRRGVLEQMKLSGGQISFNLTMTVGKHSPVQHAFSGGVNGDTMEGTVSVLHKPSEKPTVLPWRAVRAKESAYFAPTGIASKPPAVP